MYMEQIQFEAHGTIAAVDLLLDGQWWVRQRERMWENEEDDELRPSTMTRSVACLSLRRRLCHPVK